MTDIRFYMKGVGIDVSRDSVLPCAKHYFNELDNLYMPRQAVGVESYDYLYACDIVNGTKYWKIALYEWFHLVKPNGFIIIEFEDNDILDAITLRHAINTLSIYKGRFNFIKDVLDGKRHIFVLEKTETVILPPDEMDKWSFGIVTNGKRIDFINKSIESIRSLNIPKYQIIICGFYPGPLLADMKYLPFSDKDDKGWITKKKNMVCEAARYENIVVIHDRVMFEKNFYSGMKKYGPYFDVLSCPVLVDYKGRTIITNWETLAPGFKLEDDNKLFHTNGKLDVSDWDDNVIVPGPLIILKKSAWEREKWDEGLFWGDAEDIELSHRQHKAGLLIRCNSFANTRALSFSGVVLMSYYEKDTRKLGRFHAGLNPALILALKSLDAFGLNRKKQWSQSLIRYMKKRQGASSWKEEAAGK